MELVCLLSPLSGILSTLSVSCFWSFHHQPTLLTLSCLFPHMTYPYLPFVLSCQYTCNPISSSWFLSDMITHLLPFFWRFSDFVLLCPVLTCHCHLSILYVNDCLMSSTAFSEMCITDNTQSVIHIVQSCTLLNIENSRSYSCNKTIKMHITGKDKADYLHVFCSSTFSSWTNATKIGNILKMWYANLQV